MVSRNFEVFTRKGKHNTHTLRRPPMTDSMILYATRYCLGRQTYAVWECVEYLLAHWPKLGAQTRGVILRDVRYALEHDEAGAEMDRVQWRRVLDLEPPPA